MTASSTDTSSPEPEPTEAYRRKPGATAFPSDWPTAQVWLLAVPRYRADDGPLTDPDVDGEIDRLFEQVGLERRGRARRRLVCRPFAPPGELRPDRRRVRRSRRLYPGKAVPRVRDDGARGPLRPTAGRPLVHRLGPRQPAGQRDRAGDDPAGRPGERAGDPGGDPADDPGLAVHRREPQAEEQASLENLI